MRYLLCFFTLLFLFGCANNNQASPPSEQNEQNEQIKVKQTIPSKREIEGKDQEQVAERLEKIAAGVPDVKSAHSVVIGDTAIVGINVDEQLDRSRVGTIKYSVAEALRKDPYGVNAIVTADIDVTERIKEIGEEVRKGRPIAGFAEELADIIGRMMPQLPKATQPTPDDADQREQDQQEAGKNHL